MGQEEAVPKPATVVFPLEPAAAESRDMPPESPRKVKTPVRRLSVPPPPGRPPVTPSFSRARAVRPEDDPFLAAYLACTKSGGGGCNGRRNNSGGGGASRMEPNKGRRRFKWAGLALSCKGSAGGVEQSMVKMAKRPEL